MKAGLPKVVKEGRMTESEYTMLHAWVRKTFGKASECENCGENALRYDWAAIEDRYTRVRDDWMQLCRSCHRRYDKSGDPNKCKRGHEMTKDNTYRFPNDNRTACRVCRKEEHDRSNPLRNRKVEVKQ